MQRAEELLFEAASNAKCGDDDSDFEVESLIGFGVDVNVVSHDHFTPLMDAARMGNLPGVKTLIRHGASVNHRANASYGLSTNALLEAVKQGHLEVVSALIEANARVNTVDHNQQSALAMACRLSKYAHVDIIKRLLSAGAEVNSQDKWGITPLMRIIQAENGTLELVMILLDHGADLSMRDINGHTALQYAMLHEKPDILGILNAVSAKSLEDMDTLEARRCGRDELFWNYVDDEQEEAMLRDAVSY